MRYTGEKMETGRKTVPVAAAAIILHGKVLACQRGYGDLKGCWEFPGGKLEKGETGMDAIRREIREELRAEVVPERLLCVLEHDYPAFHLHMEVFLCRPETGEITLTEHQSARWLDMDALDGLAWCPADTKALPALKQCLSAITENPCRE